MYKRILVPTDGSERSVKAVEGAARFAKPLGATLVIMTVIEPYSYTNLAEYRPESIEQYDERVSAEAEERLAEAKRVADAVVRFRTFRMVRTFGRSDSISFCRDAGFRVQLRFCVGSAGKPAAGPSGFFAREGNIVFRGVA